MGKLTVLAVQREKRPGYYADGDHLYLQVSPTGTKSWIFRYRQAGHRSRNCRPVNRDMGLGSADTFSLAEARERAREQRQLLAQGLDPIEQRRQARQAAMAQETVTFAQAVERYMSRPRHWRNDKHRKQWASTLNTYAYPVIGHLDVRLIDQRHVLQILEPIWWTKNETANRVRGRLETILNYAKVHHLRSGENPAQYKGNLDHALEARSKVRKIEHHAALPYTELPGFMQALKAQPGIGAQALQFAILTAARTGEVIGARWSEIDLEAQLWIVPAAHTKANREHRVPLSDQALAVLQTAKERMGTSIELKAFVFPGRHPNKGLSNMSMLKTLQRIDRGDLTTHGFRSSFRTWAAEVTDFPREVAEAALAHVVGDKVEAAYMRSTFFEKRVRMMQAWGAFCADVQGTADVIPLRR
jgi:integrase